MIVITTDEAWQRGCPRLLSWVDVDPEALALVAEIVARMVSTDKITWQGQAGGDGLEILAQSGGEGAQFWFGAGLGLGQPGPAGVCRVV